MQEGEAPPLVLWAMSEEIRALTTIRLGTDAAPVDMLLKDAKVWGPRAVPVKKALQRLSTAALEAALQHAGQIDRLATKVLAKGTSGKNFWRLGLRLSAKIITRALSYRPDPVPERVPDLAPDPPKDRRRHAGYLAVRTFPDPSPGILPDHRLRPRPASYNQRAARSAAYGPRRIHKLPFSIDGLLEFPGQARG